MWGILSFNITMWVHVDLAYSSQPIIGGLKRRRRILRCHFHLVLSYSSIFIQSWNISLELENLTLVACSIFLAKFCMIGKRTVKFLTVIVSRSSTSPFSITRDASLLMLSKQFDSSILCQ